MTLLAIEKQKETNTVYPELQGEASDWESVEHDITKEGSDLDTQNADMALGPLGRPWLCFSEFPPPHRQFLHAFDRKIILPLFHVTVASYSSIAL
ncbi:hypothetical protein PoB_000150800 [Plakobranchus ocellatus]|uniref:Uncharacterized protein n=1 Tax=Plakobranchus ocellatus TaxID=259542 RepID=A0AAV3XXB1_9GAST|nr:hypothetical protein PoB_000150800 [Plakobranchus ocellatus]